VQAAGGGLAQAALGAPATDLVALVADRGTLLLGELGLPLLRRLLVDVQP